MTTVQELKTYLHNAIEAEASEDILRQVQNILDSKIPMASEELEAQIALGMTDVAAGRVISLEEFLERGKKEGMARRARCS